MLLFPTISFNLENSSSVLIVSTFETVTSFLSIYKPAARPRETSADIAAATSRPANVIGMHFFNPVPIMELLELVRHDGTSEETIAMAQAAGEAMKKTTILVKDVPGFATSRLGVVLGNEAIRMLADGVASAEDIDKAMVLGYKHPMGPLKLTDLVGLDVRRDILLNLQRSFNDDRYAPHPLLEEMVEKGQLGKKSGQGFFDWS